MPIPHNRYEVAVIGAGITGLAAATEASNCGLKTALVDEGLLGGLVINVGDIHGHPGIAGTSGADFINTMLSEALEAGVDYCPTAITDLSRQGDHWHLGEVTAAQVILGTGAELRTLDVPGEKEFAGRGVSQCAFCDGGLYKEKDVAVIGGGDAAFQEALHLADLCTNVTMILRGLKPRARPAFMRKAAEKDNMHFLWQTEVVKIMGAGGVEAIELGNQKGPETKNLEVAAVFPFIGLIPRTNLVSAACDESGALLVDEHMMTNQPGLYAAGAVRAGHGGQIAHAIADGKTAAQAIWRSSF